MHGAKRQGILPFPQGNPLEKSVTDVGNVQLVEAVFLHPGDKVALAEFIQRAEGFEQATPEAAAEVTPDPVAEELAEEAKCPACGAVIEEGRWSQPRKSLPAQVPAPSACCAAFTWGSRDATASAERKGVAFEMSSLIIVVIVLLFEY